MLLSPLALQTREHCFEMMEKSLYENFVAAFQHDFERIRAADYEPRSCALDLEHGVLTGSKQAMMYKVSIMKLISEIRKLSQDKTPHECFSRATQAAACSEEKEGGGDDVASRLPTVPVESAAEGRRVWEGGDCDIPAFTHNFYGGSSSAKASQLPSKTGESRFSSEVTCSTNPDTDSARGSAAASSTSTTQSGTRSSNSSPPPAHSSDSDSDANESLDTRGGGVAQNLSVTDSGADCSLNTKGTRSDYNLDAQDAGAAQNLSVADSGADCSPNTGEASSDHNNISTKDLFGDNSDDDDDEDAGTSKSDCAMNDSSFCAELTQDSNRTECVTGNSEGKDSLSGVCNVVRPAVPKIVYFWEREDYQPEESEPTEDGPQSSPIMNGEVKSKSKTHHHPPR